jgi:hypothetical protein
MPIYYTTSQFNQAQEDVKIFSGKQEEFQKLSDKYTQQADAAPTGVDVSLLRSQAETARSNSIQAGQKANAAAGIVASFQTQPVIPLDSQVQSVSAKIANERIVPDPFPTPTRKSPSTLNTLAQVAKGAAVNYAVRSAINFLKGGKKKGAGGDVPINIFNSKGQSAQQDRRVRIKVPSDYVTAFTTGWFPGEYGDTSKIIFPYTPTINVEHKATYHNNPITHSNYDIHSYQRSSVGQIKISGKFSVQNDRDAQIFLGTQHLLRSLTKMKFGNEPLSGAPPPVCRLYAYGQFMFDNVPIVIQSFNIDYPADVDYFTFFKNPAAYTGNASFGENSVPVICTLSLFCLPVYSRREMQEATVDGYLYNRVGRNKGYL